MEMIFMPFGFEESIENGEKEKAIIALNSIEYVEVLAEMKTDRELIPSD
jgi:hypothetical protein